MLNVMFVSSRSIDKGIQEASILRDGGGVSLNGT